MFPSEKICPDKWHRYFLNIAKEVSLLSKDPSTKIGVVIVKDRRIISTGYNGFPKGILDSDARLNDRNEKYKYMIHAELNALLFAGREAQGATLYIYGMAGPPCFNCAKHVIQAGIKDIVATGVTPRSEWEREFRQSDILLLEARIPTIIYYKHEKDS